MPLFCANTPCCQCTVAAATIITETINAGPTGPTDRMLSERLQELEGEGLVDRTVVPDTPVRVEYSLTKKGRALAGAMDAIASWAEKWVALDVAPSKSAKATRLRKRA